MMIPSTTPGAPGCTPIAAIVRRLAVVGALCLTVFAAIAPAAFAEEDERIKVKGGKVWFKNDRSERPWLEELIVEDTRRDGLAVRAYLEWTDRWGHHEEEVTAENSTVRSHDSIRFQVPETTRVILRVCYLDVGVISRCSVGQYAYA